MKNILLLPLIAVSLLSFFSCDKGTIDTPSANYQPVLDNIAQDVILATYSDLQSQTQVLVNALALLENTPTQGNLENARQAWRDARSPWEQSEGFLFGPVDQQGIDPSMDSWPVNQPDLDAVLASSDALTTAYIDGLDGTLKGFHTIEYLLFGLENNKPIDDFTAREFEYLYSTSQNLLASTQQLYNAWAPDGQNFIQYILTAGQAGNGVYPSQKSAIEEITIGLIGIADEVANGKINDPLVQQNVNLEESRFSANSKTDFADNMRSIRNMYLGFYLNSNGLGISQVINSLNPTLDTKVRSQIDEAILAIENIEGTFTVAIFQSPASIQLAQTKVRALQLTLESEVLPLISNL
jgi:putative iron-regulated protein